MRIVVQVLDHYAQKCPKMPIEGNLLDHYMHLLQSVLLRIILLHLQTLNDVVAGIQQTLAG